MGNFSNQKLKTYTQNIKKPPSPSKMHGFESHFANMMSQMMNNPEFQKNVNSLERAFEEASKPKSAGNCQKRKTSNSTKVCVPLKRFTPEQVQLNMNKSGLVTITASKENTEESVRNGQRKTTVMVEETCQLPGYLVENDLLQKVESKFNNGFLVITFPEDPKLVEEKKVEEQKNAPIEIPIMMEN